jgi:hypothetical protein
LDVSLENSLPLKNGDHPEIDTTSELDLNEMKKYQTEIAMGCVS